MLKVVEPNLIAFKAIALWNNPTLISCSTILQTAHLSHGKMCRKFFPVACQRLIAHKRPKKFLKSINLWFQTLTLVNHPLLMTALSISIRESGSGSRNVDRVLSSLSMLQNWNSYVAKRHSRCEKHAKYANICKWVEVEFTHLLQKE